MRIRQAREALTLLEAVRPSMPDAPVAEDLHPWRACIDALDRAILMLLNERAWCANHIGRLKKQMGLPVYVPSREAEVIANVLASNTGPLPDTAVRHLFERIIDETRSLERLQYQDDQDASDH
jgi:chorismate mutase-like protein